MAVSESEIKSLGVKLDGLSDKLAPLIGLDVARVKEDAQKAVDAAGQITESYKEIKAAREELAAMRKEADEAAPLAAQVKSLEERLAAAEAKHDAAEAERKRVSGRSASQSKSLGEMVTESPAYVEYAKAWAGGANELGAPGKNLVLKHAGDLREFKAALTLTGNPLTDSVRSRTVELPHERLFLEDLMETLPTSTDHGHYLRWSKFAGTGDSSTTINQGGAAAGVTEIGAIPETELRGVEAEWHVRDVATLAYVSENSLADAPYVRRTIDTELAGAVDYSTEQALVYGDGSAPNLQGYLHAGGGLQARAWSAGEVGDTVIDCIRRGIADVRLKHYFATAIVLNPTDWAGIEIQKASDGHYLYTVLMDGTRQVVWRLPVIETLAITAGTSFLADFRNIGHLRNRQLTEIRMSEHVKFETRQITIRAVRRIANVIERPLLGVKLTFDAAPV